MHVYFLHMGGSTWCFTALMTGLEPHLIVPCLLQEHPHICVSAAVGHTVQSNGSFSPAHVEQAHPCAWHCSQAGPHVLLHCAGNPKPPSTLPTRLPHLFEQHNAS